MTEAARKILFIPGVILIAALAPFVLFYFAINIIAFYEPLPLIAAVLYTAFIVGFFRFMRKPAAGKFQSAMIWLISCAVVLFGGGLSIIACVLFLS